MAVDHLAACQPPRIGFQANPHDVNLSVYTSIDDTRAITFSLSANSQYFQYAPCQQQAPSTAIFHNRPSLSSFQRHR